MNIIDDNYDIIVVGAGMIGSAMAIGLAKEGWRVLLLEYKKPKPFSLLEHPDLRVSMISYTSVNLLKQLNVWNSILSIRATPYRRIEVWEKEKSNVIFEAKSLGLSELGYIVENRILQLALWKQFFQYSNLTLLCPAKLVIMHRQNQQWKIILNDKKQFLTNLIIAADGVHSQVRTLAGIGSNGWQYDQLCLLITIKMDQAQQDITWQQFFPSGPRAFLPLFDHWACLVWYDKPSRIRQLQAMSILQLRQEIILAFPDRLGQFQVFFRDNFSIIRQHANRYVEEGLALVGDAAHTINPLGGQGLNLGYRDINILLKVLINSKTHLSPPFYTKQTLLLYQQDRMADNRLMQVSMDAIYTLFSTKLTGIKFARNLVLMLVQRLNIIKKSILKSALGL
ncbi:MAG: FAD-dependent monooxygenase [Arsenophonus sp. ER-BJ3-MAG3]